jgi:hypothetical protein
MDRFEPAPYLKNGHVQTLVNSMKLRRPLVRRRAAGMLAAAVPKILDCGGGVRLLGYYSPGSRSPETDLCILIHGWEGDATSSYLLSAAGFLWRRGFSVFRLNLRDHGPTHHLNPELFHACRLDEAIGAVRCIQHSFPWRRLFLAGYSLGGNFALRIAAEAHRAGLSIERAAAVCPVLNPDHTLSALAEAPPVYHWYFLKKWRRSLAIKERLYPGLVRLDEIRRLHSIRTLTEYFVERHTDFSSAADYLAGYAVVGDRLADLRIPATIIASMDDPVIPASDLDELAATEQLAVETHPHGGHCGFILDWRMQSWSDRRLAELFESS